MKLRSKKLDKETNTSIITAYNALNDKAVLKKYFKDLHMEVSNYMAKKGRPEDLELLKDGMISKRAVGIVMIKRLKERGDNKFTTIVIDDEKFISSGKIKISAEDRSTKNKAFRAAVKTGPFIDNFFTDKAKGGHGVFTHIIQRDIVTQAMLRNNQNPQKLWNYLGTPKGINFWADLFDSGDPKSFTRPEVLSKFLFDDLSAR